MTISAVWALVLGILGSILVLWAALIGLLLVAARRDARSVDLRSMLRLIPDLLRLLQRLARDPSLQKGVRVWLLALLAYLALPIDLIPDFIPVVGFADDIVVLALGLRAVVRAAGPEAIARHWSGTEDGLAAVLRLARVV